MFIKLQRVLLGQLLRMAGDARRGTDLTLGSNVNGDGDDEERGYDDE